MKIENKKDTRSAFKRMTPKLLLKNLGYKKNPGHFKQFREIKNSQHYDTLSETKSAFIERNKQFLENSFRNHLEKR